MTTAWRIFFASPKKPNSGKRRVSKARIRHAQRHDRLTARLTASNMFPRKFQKVLIRGGRANDTPGVTYTAVRGAHDLGAPIDKNRRRSFYGVKRPVTQIQHIRKL